MLIWWRRKKSNTELCGLWLYYILVSNEYISSVINTWNWEGYTWINQNRPMKQCLAPTYTALQTYYLLTHLVSVLYSDHYVNYVTYFLKLRLPHIHRHTHAYTVTNWSASWGERWSWACTKTLQPCDLIIIQNQQWEDERCSVPSAAHSQL